MAPQDIDVVYGLPNTFLMTKHFLAETKRVQGFSDSLTRGLAVSGKGGGVQLHLQKDRIHNSLVWYQDSSHDASFCISLISSKSKIKKNIKEVIY